MDTLVGQKELAQFVGAHLKDSFFTLIDVGCAGGVHDLWRAFGARLKAWAFDADAAECARIQSIETCREVRYFPSFVTIPPDHPFRLARKRESPWSGNPWDRFSVVRSVQLRSKSAAAAQVQSPREPTGGETAEREDRKSEVAYLDRFIVEQDIRDLDFLKIDVDGNDLAILHGVKDELATLKVLGVGIEVNFFGTDDPTDHTFHNVDRFMRAQGFDLFGLVIRRYSTAALPSRYVLPFPSDTEFGRPAQGDALYIRDLCAPANKELADSLGPEKLAKAAAIFSLNNVPDCAAEIILNFRKRLNDVFDTARALDILAAGVSHGQLPTNYRNYVQLFQSDSHEFYSKA
jgi:hypothetical protein